MAIFKESEVKAMLNELHSEQISFSKFVEQLNDAAHTNLAKNGSLVSMMDIVRTLELFIAQNQDRTESKLIEEAKSFASFIKAYAVKGAMENLKLYDAKPKIH